MECVAIPGFHVRACFFSSIRAYVYPSISNFLEFLVSMKGVQIEREREKKIKVFLGSLVPSLCPPFVG